MCNLTLYEKKFLQQLIGESMNVAARELKQNELDKRLKAIFQERLATARKIDRKIKLL